MLKLRILIAETRYFSSEAKDMLEQFAEVDMIDIQKDALKNALIEYDVFWFRLGFPIEAQDLPEQPRCRFIVCPVTGLDHIDEIACSLKGIKILSLRGETDFLQSIRATAELSIGLTLALLRKIPQAANDVLRGNWERDRFKGRELMGKTVGIAGMGRLGKIAAQYYRAFGCNVLGYDPQDFSEEGVMRCHSLEDLVALADIVCIHINYLPENHHLFNDALFFSFKTGSLLINTARGALIDSQALIRQLESGQLAGAALDVIEQEHSFEHSPLIAYAREHDNLLITPHIGGNTSESFAKTEKFMAIKLYHAIHA